MVISDSKVTHRVAHSYGGRRITDGQVSVDLWSDGVVLGAAWTMATPGIEGELFSFRGILTRSRFATRSLTWRLELADGTYVDSYATRKDALEAAADRCVMASFRELNRIEAAR
jgi:hypothetical protein